MPSAKTAPAAPMSEAPLNDLTLMIRSQTPLIAVESNEESTIVNLARRIGQRFQMKAFRWTVTEGLQAFEPCDQPLKSVTKSLEVLTHIKSEAQYSLFVLLDFHPYLQDAVHVRHLKDIALSYTRHQSTVVLVGCALQVPVELQPFTAKFELPLPTEDELRGIVVDVAAEWGAAHGERNVQTTNKVLDQLVRNLTGLTATDARRIAFKAINDDGIISESDLPEVARAKYELLGRDGVLSFEYETSRFSEVGGMRRLRQWVEVRRDFFLGNTSVELDPPRGLLLLGVQGCGKSLAAKAVAGIFGVPLLRLDFGVLYNKYYGETERNLRKALETAELMSPCVLWMDEIEKGVAVQSDDDGLSRRVLGTFLTWMAEHRKPVFIVATANDIAQLPPELVRKGRFDEIFFVDLPPAGNRREIFDIHFRKRALATTAFNLDQLVAATEGFSGAEIEQAIVSAMYAAHAASRPLNADDLMNEIQHTRPLSVVMAERVAATREWAAERTVPCD
ncbi:MAG TPA: AAA family ATPase [Verrucomicrobiae bacterium]|nr:AAA family ATPase [Verrucomicrobiae bacterium]